jgi:hypothetical protein
VKYDVVMGRSSTHNELICKFGSASLIMKNDFAPSCVYHFVGFPFPLPIRTSAGFPVIGRSARTLTHILQFLRNCPLIAFLLIVDRVNAYCRGCF